MEECGNSPWCLHLSYIKPHWPYVAPDPYHRLYASEDIPQPVRSHNSSSVQRDSRAITLRSAKSN